MCWHDLFRYKMGLTFKNKKSHISYYIYKIARLRYNLNLD